MKLIPAIRGMRDILPPDTRVWRHIENVVATRFERFGYGEIRTPILESAELFSRQLGKNTDIVRKEMYQFNDKSREKGGDEDKGDMICLRPESTVSTMRAAVAAGLHRSELCRLWYGGPMFRRERPQAGRYRQFWQMGVEALSSNKKSPEVDAEQIIMLSELWADLGIAGRLQLLLNNLGSAEERENYREKLRDYFGQYESDLDDTAKRQLKGNPLRLLDAKEGRAAELAADAPKMFLGERSRQYVDDVCNIISAAGVSFQEAPLLVRGLDYYNLTVFEWVMKDDERRQNTICGGGRYDGLAEQIGAPPLFGCGFALGLDRLVSFVEKYSEKESSIKTLRGTYCFLTATGASSAYCTRVAAMLRAGDFSVWQHTGSGNLAKQIKKASNVAAVFAVIIGKDEEEKETVLLKHLGGEGQQSAALSDVAKVARNMMEMHEQSANANQNKNKKHTTRSAQQ